MGLAYMTTTMKVRRIDQAGYTLIELLVVVAIIGILARIAVRSGSTCIQTRARFVDDFMGDVRFARQRAIVSGTHYDVYFSTATQYQLRKLVQNGSSWDVGSVVKTVNLPSSLSWTPVTSTGSHYQFNTRGMQVAYSNPLSAGPLTLTVDGCGSPAHQVSIWASGQVYEEQ